MILRLFDVSQFIHSGKLNLMYADGFVETAENFIPREICVGGIAYLIEEVERFRNQNTEIVMCIDRPPTIKREIMNKVFPYEGGYKGKRSQKNPAVFFQREIIHEILEAIGFNVLYKDGYEADDLIASIVQIYKDDYEKVYIHSRDSDLYYLVDEKVECVPVGNSGKHITLNNWENSVITGLVTPYNMLTLNKMRRGERGDNIPPAPDSIMYEIMSKIRVDKFKYCGDNRLLEEVIRKVSNNDEKTVAVMQLIMPLILSQDEIYLHDEPIDWELFDYFRYALLGKGTYTFAAKVKGSAMLSDFVDRWMSM